MAGNLDRRCPSRQRLKTSGCLYGSPVNGAGIVVAGYDCRRAEAPA